jgi:hypothetical protein
MQRRETDSSGSRRSVSSRLRQISRPYWLSRPTTRGRRRRDVQLDISENHQRGQVDASRQPLPQWSSTAVENNKTKASKSKKASLSAANKGKGKASTNTGNSTGAGARLFGGTSSNIKTRTPAFLDPARVATTMTFRPSAERIIVSESQCPFSRSQPLRPRNQSGPRFFSS